MNNLNKQLKISNIMKTTRTTLLATMVAAMILIFVGCKKEEVVEKMSESASTADMLRFKTAEDFSNYLENAETNNQKDGFVSFGKMADDAYYSINPEEMFSDMDEVIQFVLDNRDLYQLILCSDGEYMVETRMYDHPFRNVANTDGIFQVGDTLYKIIEGGYAYTSVDKMDCLKQYVDKGYRQNTSDLKFYTFGERTETKHDRYAHYCTGEELYNENTIGNNRITLKISNYQYGPINNNYCQCGYTYFAKPYHYSIGWWGCNRTITANVYSVVLGIGGLFNITNEYGLPSISNLVHGGSSFEFSEHGDQYHLIQYPYSIIKCNCSASTPDAGTVIVSCY